MSWGSDTRLHSTFDAFCDALRTGLREGLPRVLKQHRGNGGNGVWKVERIDDARLRIRHALRGSVEEELSLDEFLQRCVRYFAGGGHIIDQPYQPRLPDGMIRCYIVRDRVAGFGRTVHQARCIEPPPGVRTRRRRSPGPRDHARSRHRRAVSGARAQNGNRVGAADDRQRSASTRRRCRSSGTPIFFTVRAMRRRPTAYVLCEINVSPASPSPTRRSDRSHRRPARNWRRDQSARDMTGPVGCREPRSMARLCKPHCNRSDHAGSVKM